MGQNEKEIAAPPFPYLLHPMTAKDTFLALFLWLFHALTEYTRKPSRKLLQWEPARFKSPQGRTSENASHTRAQSRGWRWCKLSPASIFHWPLLMHNPTHKSFWNKVGNRWRSNYTMLVTYSYISPLHMDCIFRIVCKYSTFRESLCVVYTHIWILLIFESFCNRICWKVAKRLGHSIKVLERNNIILLHHTMHTNIIEED